MAKPQQPEIARSGHGATDPAAVKSELSVPRARRRSTGDGPVPDDNMPGHHPDHEQDKPTGDAFVRKLHEHAEAPPPAEPDPTVAGEALRTAASVARRVRRALPGD